MASNVFSRLVQTAQGRSFYEDLRRRHDDTEDRAGLLDEENLNHEFQDYDLEHAEGLAVGDSRAILGSVTNPASRGHGPAGGQLYRDTRSAWVSQEEDGDNDVPASLLVEREDDYTEGTPGPSTGNERADQPPAAAMPGSSKARVQWEATQAQQRLHDDAVPEPSRRGSGLPNSLFTGIVSGSAKKKAEWRWANVSNLDTFIKDVYDYYIGHGVWCILVERVLHLVNVAFVALLLTFLTQCLDYSKLRGSQKLSQIIIPHCTRNMSGLWNLGLWMFAFYFIWKSIQYLLDLRRLLNVRDFYLHLLNIPDQDMQTITWQEVVARIMALRDHNPKTATSLTPAQRRWLGSQSKERLDASDIANRLMRRENYLIALFNKDILNLTIPFPFLHNRQLFSRTMEWMLMFTILDFVFDERGQVNQEFLRSERRGELSLKLRGRFVFAGVMILILSPFVVAYLMVVYFLMYYHEIQKNPSILSSRTYTPLAEWKFREFNELPHLFRKRLDMSHPFASHYIDQFPKAKTEMVFRTVAFISGSLATILALASVVDSELFLGFEITPDRTALFYTAVFGAVFAFARGNIAAENSVFDPEYAMRNVIQYTHYEPDHWKDRLHSFDIKQEFSELYKVKVVIFLEEILSILTTPFVLFSSLPTCSDQIIDFFREFTIHVDGLGYVCSFAEFDFKKGMVTSKRDNDGDVRDDYYATKHGKMEASYYGFMDNYGNFALNPRTGAASHLPPGTRNQFHPPPAWPSISTAPLVADLQSSRIGRERAKGGGSNKTPRYGPTMPQQSPMASILLDPHHQPPKPSRAQHASRHLRAGYHGERSIIEETQEDDGEASEAGRRQDEEAYEGGGALDESAWQTSPAVTLSRDNSTTEARGAPDAGVVHMIYQFNQAQLHRRPGGVH
ncbi:autophagy protein Apg9-domain-containing protein [Chaetomium strumarium]|uniref:Autophagy-related protein 9 n=1 Tax=Chaetomium strumarium TaxID=1170767 RepID=A0AAJ0GSW5_9PEZI|nr:autophagy protein Apg9-domain-containing protein [Chaetomium strumarium]